MSRSLLIATSTSSSFLPPDPIDPPDPSPEEVYGLYSSAMPSTTEHGSRIIRVGPGRTHTTIGAGITAADALLTGTQRALVIVDAGTYNEQVYTARGVDIAGVTGSAADVVIEHECPTGNSPLNTNGGPVWVGGLTTRMLDYPERTGTATYSIHHHGEELTIFEGLLLDNEGNLGSIGMDGGGGSGTWLIDCELANHLGTADRVTNMHGAPENTAPLRLVYDNVTTNGLGVNYNDGGSGQPDEVYVVGGSVHEIDANGANLTAVVDPAVTVVTTGVGVTLIRSTDLPTRPFHGSA